MLSNFSDDIRKKETLLSSFTELAAEQSKNISCLSAVIHDTVLWDGDNPRPGTSSTPNPQWSDVVVRGQKKQPGRHSCLPFRLNLKNRYSTLSDVNDQADVAAARQISRLDDAPATAPSKASTVPTASQRTQSGSDRTTLPTPAQSLVVTDSPVVVARQPPTNPANPTPVVADPPAAISRDQPPVNDHLTPVAGAPAGASAVLSRGPANVQSGPSQPILAHRPHDSAGLTTAGSGGQPRTEAASCPVSRGTGKSARSSARHKLVRSAVSRRSEGHHCCSVSDEPLVSLTAKQPSIQQDLQQQQQQPSVQQHPPLGLTGATGNGHISSNDCQPAPPRLLFSPSTLIIGDSIIRHVRFVNVITHCIPGAVATVVQAKLQDILSSLPSTVNRIIVHVGSKDTDCTMSI